MGARTGKPGSRRRCSRRCSTRRSSSPNRHRPSRRRCYRCSWRRPPQATSARTPVVTK